MTKERQQILDEMLNQIDDSLSKAEGELIFETVNASAIQFADTYKELNTVKDKLSIENLSGAELEQWVKERTGITRRLSTYSIGKKLNVTGNGIINVGNLFETRSGIQFEATETKSIVGQGVINIKCTIAGTIGNVPANQIVLMPVTLSGITAVNNPEPTYDGFEAESDSDLLQRYYDRIRTPATSGNRNHYLNWAKSISGIGDAKVFPLWDGDNTVKVVIIDSNRNPASVDLVERVQNYIDPNISGLGDGVAPVGAFCSVRSAIGKEIDISFNALLDTGYVIEQVQEIVSINISNYLKEMAFIHDFISYAQIGSIIINSEGILDYTNLLINGGSGNLTIENDEVAILGGVEIVE